MKGSFSNTFGMLVGSGLVFGVIIVLIGAWGGFLRGFGTPTPQVNYGFIFGSYPTGVIIGLLLVNRLLHYQGSLLWGILSIIIGGAVVVGIVSIIPTPHVSKVPGGLITAILFFFLGPPLLGILGFHLGYRKG